MYITLSCVHDRAFVRRRGPRGGRPPPEAWSFSVTFTVGHNGLGDGRGGHSGLLSLAKTSGTASACTTASIAAMVEACTQHDVPKGLGRR